MTFFAHESAYVDEPRDVGDGSRIWHYTHVMSGARVGRDCVLGQNVHVATGATLGDRVKVQNNVSIFAGTIVEDDVFLGPSCVLTNVKNPRAQIDRRDRFERTLIRRGATVGANATIVCGVTLGRYSFVAAGAVVTRDVPDYGFVIGAPARRRGWMSRHGQRLRAPDAEGIFRCAESGLRYRETQDGLRCLDLDEDAPLPVDLRASVRSFDELSRGNGGGA